MRDVTDDGKQYGTNTADQGSGKKTKAPKAKLDWQNASPEVCSDHSVTAANSTNHSKQHSLDQNAAMLMNLTRQVPAPPVRSHV
jgi:hypothetical protein